MRLMAVSVERAAKNQVFFREVNERIADLSEPALEGQAGLFVCECSQTDCTDTLEIEFAEYDAVRQNGARFVVVPGHEIEGIERVVSSNGRFAVVEKLDEARTVAVDHDPRRS